MQEGHIVGDVFFQSIDSFAAVGNLRFFNVYRLTNRMSRCILCWPFALFFIRCVLMRVWTHTCERTMPPRCCACRKGECCSVFERRFKGTGNVTIIGCQLIRDFEKRVLKTDTIIHIPYPHAYMHRAFLAR